MKTTIKTSHKVGYHRSIAAFCMIMAVVLASGTVTSSVAGQENDAYSTTAGSGDKYKTVIERNTAGELSQEDFRQELAHNVDNDDAGEYGTFGLLSGATPTSKGKPAEPPFVDERFKIADADGIAETKGYRFRLFLPTKERRVEGRISSVTDEREMFWCAYAWPVEPGKTGRRVFFISSSNRIFAKDAAEATYPIEAGQAYVGEPLTSDVDVSGWLLVR